MRYYPDWDLVFLDIEMPVMNGFDMLRLVMHHPKVIFTTAFDQYAIKAFEENSIDYLLKPIGYSDFIIFILNFFYFIYYTSL